MRNQLNLVLFVAVLTLLPACAKEQPAEPAELAEPAESAESTASKGPVTFENKQDRASYAIGLNFGRTIQQQGVPLTAELVVRGLEDGLSGAEPALSEADLRETMTDFQREFAARQQARMQEEGEKNKVESAQFLASNSERDGVVTLPSGLQYEILEEGSGPKPVATDRVTVHYKGSLVDGTVFDSSYERGQPATFRLDQVVPGWTEGLQLMSVGSKWKLFIPSNLGYGPMGQPPRIGPESALMFEVELLSVEGK